MKRPRSNLSRVISTNHIRVTVYHGKYATTDITGFPPSAKKRWKHFGILKKSATAFSSLRVPHRNCPKNVYERCQKAFGKHFLMVPLFFQHVSGGKCIFCIFLKIPQSLTLWTADLDILTEFYRKRYLVGNHRNTARASADLFTQQNIGKYRV
jgi:hypothetical protein